ncbi:hypothetical protein [Rufibacter roseolus]|uniref:hypothetical protein n=1 Tax=Rufibacter roseolus TaxID=2817375 RepID=UPI001B30742E|nr:hypothetical protein [Rufibacter roseolus]
MKEYTLKFNFLIPILRIAFLIFSVGMVILMVSWILKKEWEGISEDAVFVFYTFFIIWLFSLGAYQMIKGVLTECLWIRISDERIVIRNLILQRKYFLAKADISSIFPSSKKLGRTNWDSIVIYTREGKSYELIQFNYFDFKKFKELFISFGYKRPNTEVIDYYSLASKNEK